MNSSTRLTIAVVLCALAATAAGCGSSAETYFYQLSTTPGDDTATVSATPKPRLGIGPITLPAYLDRSQVVVRDGAHGLELREFNQWAEPLRENFERVFCENLARRIGTDRVALHPMDTADLDCRIAVRVIHFEGDASGKCTLEARWTVTAGGQVRVEKASKHEAGVSGDTDSVSGMVAAMSQALGAFSDEVASAVKATLAK